MWSGIGPATAPVLATGAGGAGAGAGRGGRPAGHGGRHHRPRDLGVPAGRAGDQAAPGLLVERRAVLEPAVELMILGATQLIVDHPSRRPQHRVEPVGIKVVLNPMDQVNLRTQDTTGKSPADSGRLGGGAVRGQGVLPDPCVGNEMSPISRVGHFSPGRHVIRPAAHQTCRMVSRMACASGWPAGLATTRL